MNPDLCKAVTKGNSALLSHLFKTAGDNVRREQRDQNKNTLLHIAASYNNVHVVEVIRKNQPTTTLRSKNYTEDTALHIAARHNNAEVVKYLLRWAKKTDKEDKRSKAYLTAFLKNRDGNTALHEAVLRRHREVIEVFMELDKEVLFIKNKHNESSLYLAADRGLHVELGKMMIVALEDEASKKMKNLPVYEGLDGKTLLHAAVVKKHILCVNIILDKKKELISREDDGGRNPLHYAALFGHSEEARCILEKDAQIAHKKDNQGMYPIYIAANKGHVGIIGTMLKYCRETIETLYEGDQNVFHLAAKSGRGNSVSYMLQQKSDFEKFKNAKDIDGNTPLHLATKNSYPKVVSILMWGRVDKTIMNKEGLTALDIAEEQMMEISLPKVLTLTTL
ncbi:protein ACCELERATED CELL DEATH 6-like [Macadamia integrifolia]|uniref:protein ACCELERATED CELL DEATH 6-like n=1 Tax=Macadamia integrifolia TaxID=60698 RepID=UPI001C4FCFA6|nr:protein ACCELERATED CELL DEATH 6-like [Macadamia integrifolia]